MATRKSPAPRDGSPAAEYAYQLSRLLDREGLLDSREPWREHPVGQSAYYAALQGKKLPTWNISKTIIESMCSGNMQQWAAFDEQMRAAFRSGRLVRPWKFSEAGYPLPDPINSYNDAEQLETVGPTTRSAFSETRSQPDDTRHSIAHRVLATGFELAIRSAQIETMDESELLVNLDEHSLNVRGLARATLTRSRLVVQGGAASGKTVLSLRAMSALTDTARVVVPIRQWSQDFGPRLLGVDFAGPTRDWKQSLDIILEGATADISMETFEALVGGDRPVVLLVDGIDASSEAIARRVLDVLDAAIRHFSVNLHVVVTDRSSDRYPPTGKWKIAKIQPLDETYVKSIIDTRFGISTWGALEQRSRRLLRSPFFLDLATRGADPRQPSRADALGSFVYNRADLAPEHMREAADVTIEAYRSGSRNIRKANLSATTRIALLDAGIVRQIADDATLLSFSNALFGDYFASVALAAETRRWHPTGLDQISFSGDRWRFDGLSADSESFDAVTLAAEQIGSVEIGDTFLRAVYDWNWRAAVECLAATSPTSPPFSEEARIAVIGLLCERLSDPVDGTQRRARRLLAQLPDACARTIVDLNGLAARRRLVDLTASVPGQWISRWQRVYSRAEDYSWSSSDLTELLDNDALMGWTASYALKRHTIAEPLARELIGIYRGLSLSAGYEPDLNASVRWRIVHALAAGEAEVVLGCLLSALDEDHYPWVRWGAVRSVTELAARGNRNACDLAVGALLKRVGSLTPAMVREVAWVAQYQGADQYFARVIRPLIEVAASSSTDDAYEQSRQWLQRFDDFWSTGVNTHLSQTTTRGPRVQD